LEKNVGFWLGRQVANEIWLRIELREFLDSPRVFFSL
jgi:hypothetical protein